MAASRPASLGPLLRGALQAPFRSSVASVTPSTLAPVFTRRVVASVAAMDATEEDTSNSSSIFISNLSWSTDDGRLGDHLSSEVGGLRNVNLLMRDGRSRGMAICDFESPEQARSAVERLNETDLDGRTITVRIATPRAPREPRGDRYGDRGYGERREPRGDRYGDRDRGYGGRGEGRRERGEGRGPQRDPDTQLFVGNLSWDTTWQEVKDAFAEAGHPVAFANVKKGADGRSRGFAVVAFDDPSSAAAAAEALHQTELGGRTINVRRFNAE